MNFSEAMFYDVLFDIGFPYKHCYFEPVCLLVKMASKTVIRPIHFMLRCTIRDYNVLFEHWELVNSRFDCSTVQMKGELFTL